MATLDDWLKSQGADPAPNLLAAEDANPDSAAQALQQSRRNNVPPSLIGMEPDPEITRRESLESRRKVLDGSPKLSQWLASQPPLVTAATQDDLDNLSTLDKTIQFFGDNVLRPMGGGTKRLSSGVNALVGGAADLVGLDSAADWLYRAAADEKMRAETMGAAANQGGMLQTAWGNALESFTQMGLTFPIGAGLGGTATQVGKFTLPSLRALAPIGVTTAGQEFQSGMEAGLSKPMAALYGAGQGGVEMITEALPLGTTLKFLDGGSSLLKTIGKVMIEENVGEQLATHWQDMNQWLLLNPEKSVDDYLAERPNAALQTALSTTLAVGMQGSLMGLSSRRTRDTEEADKGDATQELVKQLNKLGQASKIAERDVDTYENFLETATAEGPVQDLYIDAETFKQSGVADQVMEVSPSVQAQYQEALATGGSIRIPLSEYGARIATLPELSGPLLAHLKTDPMGFSKAEADTYRKEQGPALEAEVARILEQTDSNEAFNTSRDVVKQSVLDNLNAVNRNTPAVNETYATLVAARTAVRAKQLGITPEEMFAKQQLRVQGEQVGGEVVNQGIQYPMAPRDEWWGEGTYKEDGGRIVYVTPDEYLAAVKPLNVDESDSRENIDILKDHILAGKTLDPLLIRANGKEDGRHRAYAAKELGIEKVPVIAYGDQFKDADQTLKQSAYHGSPHRFDRFDLSKIGTGEGNQSYGWGLYFADSKDVAEGYKDRLTKGNIRIDGKPFVPGNYALTELVARHSGNDTELLRKLRGYILDKRDNPYANTDDAEKIIQAIESNKFEVGSGGQLYPVDIPDEAVAKMLDWDQPLSNQSPDVKAALAKLGLSVDKEKLAEFDDALLSALTEDVDSTLPKQPDNPSGEDIYRRLVRKLGGDKAASEALQEAGIPGLRYFDGQSRTKSDGTRNTVIWDQKLLDQISEGLQTFYQSNNGITPDVARSIVDDEDASALPEGWFLHGRARANVLADNWPIQMTTDPIVAVGYAGSKGSVFAIRRNQSTRYVDFSATDTSDMDSFIAELEKNFGLQKDDTSSPIGAVVDAIRNSQESDDVSFSDFEDSVRDEFTPEKIVESAQAFDSDVYMNLLEFYPGGWPDMVETPNGAVVIPGAKDNVDSVNLSELAKADDLNQPARGGYSPSKNIITLLKNADLSTFLHESAHYFFENDIALAKELIANPEPTAGERQILDDTHALLKWHGLEGDLNEQLDQWNQLDFEQKRAHHERTAESFEAYLFSGKAPNIELATYFSKFREFMLSVYKSLKQFLAGHPEAGKLNDEVRGVFDRMLATDEQIALAEQARSMLPLFKMVEEASKFGVDFEAYQALAKGSTQAAVEALQAKGLQDMQWLHNAHGREVKKLKKKSEAVRREIRMEERAKVLQQPVYQAWTFLTRKLTEDDKITKAAKLKTLDPSQDSLFTSIAKLGGLNKEEVVSTWGVDPKANAMPEFGKHVLKKEGRSIDSMLEVLAGNGYLSLDENGKADTRELEEKFDNELRGHPEYSFQKDYDAPQVANPEALGAGRFDLGELMAMDISSEIIKRLEDFKMTRKTGGLHPDLIADLYQFGSADELVKALYAADPPQTAIEKATDARMLAEYGELATEEAIAKAADAALYNAARGKMLVADANALAQATEVRKDAGTDKKGRKRTVNILPAAAREAARNLISRVVIRNLRPAQYESAEIKAGKATEKAKNAGKLSEAAAQARTRLFNYYAAMEAHSAVDEVADGVAKVKKLLGKGAQGNMRGDALVQMNALAARFDFRTSLSAKEIDAKVPLAEWVKAESERLSAVMPDLPATVLDETYKKHYKDMTLEEFRGLMTAIKQLEFMARREQKQYIAVRNQNFEQETASILDVIRQNFPKAFDENGKPLSSIPDFVPSLSKTMKELGDKAIGEFISPENILDLLEAGQYGPVSESLFGRLTHASDWKAERLEQIYREMKPTMKAYSLKERYDFARKGIAVPEIGTSVTRENAVMVALLYGNKEGQDRLANYGWGPVQVQAILRNLTDKDIDLIESIWKQFDQGLWPELKALNERTRGIAPPKVEATPYSINGRQLQGGYMRLKYDTELDERAHNLDEGAAVKELLGGGMGMSSKTNQGTSTARKQGVKLRPRLTLSVFSEAITETVHDLAYREAIADTIRLLNDDEVQHAIKSAQGTPAYRALVARVREVAAPPRNPSGFVEKIFSVARKNTVINLMSGVKTALQNFTGLFPAMTKVPVASLVKEVALFASPLMRERVRFAMGQSSYMRGRFNNFDRDLADMTKKLTVNGSIKPDDSVFLAMMSTVDRMVAVPVWNAAFKDGMKQFGNDQTTATDYADKIVRQTQGSGRDVDMARIMSGHGGWGQLKKVFTMFYSYFNGQLGLLVTTGAITKREAQTNPALATAKFTAKFMTIVALPAVLTEILMRGIGEDDDDPEKWAKVFGMYLLAMVPVLRDVARGVQSYYAPDAKYNASYRLSPIESSIQTMIQVPGSVHDIWTGNSTDYDTKTAILGTSFALGLPGKLISDTVLGTDAWLSGEAGPQSVILGPPPPPR